MSNLQARPNLSVAAEAIGLLHGIDSDWNEYLTEIINLCKKDKICLDWASAKPLPKQLRNPSVITQDKKGDMIYLSTQVWLVLDAECNRSLIIPPETSGVLIEKETGKIINNFNGLPMITPDGTNHLIRISIRREEEEAPEMKWTLYSATKT